MYDISDCLSIHLAITVTASTNWRFNQVDGIAAKKTLPEIRMATIQVCANDAFVVPCMHVLHEVILA